jgi:hypothetical protein
MLFTDKPIQDLFVVKNFKFYTLDSDPKRNVPTLYFEDANGNKGRIRQVHPKGPQISYQGNCTRIFFDDNDPDTISMAPVKGYRVFEELGRTRHISGGFVGLDTDPVKNFDLSKFKAFPISDWTAVKVAVA